MVPRRNPGGPHKSEVKERILFHSQLLLVSCLVVICDTGDLMKAVLPPLHYGGGGERSTRRHSIVSICLFVFQAGFDSERIPFDAYRISP